MQPRLELLHGDTDIFEIVAEWHWREWSHGDGHAVRSEWRERLNSRTHDQEIPFTLVAFVDGRPVGSLSVCNDDRDARFAENGPWLAGMFVLGPARNLGIGRALLRGAEERSRSFGATEMWLYTSEAGPFYERCGYQYAHRKEGMDDNAVLWRVL
jgi:GNAT superfamily N-acetyltransferase